MLKNARKEGAFFSKAPTVKPYLDYKEVPDDKNLPVSYLFLTFKTC